MRSIRLKFDKKARFLLIGVLLAFLVGIVILWSQGVFSRPKNVSNIPLVVPDKKYLAGAELFRQHCAICHAAGGGGADLEKPGGGFNWNGSYIAPALNGTGHAWHHSDEVLFDTIKNGSIEEESPMRGFKGSLKDEEIRTIIQYLKSLWPEKIRKNHAMSYP